VRGFARILAVSALAVIALASSDRAVAGQAQQLYPVNLQIEGGEDHWHAENVFFLYWERQPVANQGFPVAAVHFRVRDAAGTVVVRETRLPGDRIQIQNIDVPPVPGTYTADVWLEGPGGEPGPTVSAALRFDNTRPGAAHPISPAGWIAGNAAAVVAIQPPAGPLPVSGLRGYAVSVDRSGEGRPCAARDWCSEAETNLRGGIDDNTLSLGTLPEGISIVRAVAVSGSGVSSAETDSAIVRVDATRPETTLAGAPKGWTNGPVRLVAQATDSLSGMTAAGPGGAYTAIAVDGSVPRIEPGDSTAVTVTGEGTHSVAFYARDTAGNVDRVLPRTATVSIDESPPHVTFARAQDPAEPERIEATVADPLSGPDPERGAIAVRAANTRRRWLPLPTATTAGRLVARWDSDSFAAGAYEFSATGYDTAGNATVSDRRGNRARMVLINPLKVPVRLRAGFGRRHPSAATTVAYGRTTFYEGRLTSSSGSPLDHLPVQVVETFDAGAASPLRSTRVLTAADGSFSIRLLPGPSRRVEAMFSGNRTLSRAGGGEGRLQVLGGVSIRSSTHTARIGGAPIVFRGRIGDLGASMPDSGRAVELQFRLPGGEWAEFRTVQTDAHGRYRYAYAFSDDDSRGVRFQFRAYTSGGDWPYEPAASRPVFVTGR
jgi:hypothetical protein